LSPKDRIVVNGLNLTKDEIKIKDEIEEINLTIDKIKMRE
jgi:hypothetical protein